MTYKMPRFFTLVAILFALLTISSCKKPAGPGGKASIKGKIYIRDFNTAATAVISEYYGPGENVYICYGGDNAVGNNVKTSTDGSYEFLYLRTGHYKIFAESRDTSIHVSGSNKLLSVALEVDITDSKQTLSLPDIIVNR